MISYVAHVFIYFISCKEYKYALCKEEGLEIPYFIYL